MAKSSKSSNDDGRGSQRDARSSAASAKSSSSGGSGYSPQSERAPSKSSSSQAPSGASRATSSSSVSKSSSNSDGRGSQREQVKSAQQAKSSIGSGNSGSSNRAANSDGRGSQRDTRASAMQAKSSKLADSVGTSLASIGQSITGKMRDVNAGIMMQAINSFSAGLSGIDPDAGKATNVKTGLKGNAGIIADTLASLGRKPHEIAGILGRLTQESSLNPEAIRKNDNKKYKGELAHSIGVGQWNGTRQQALKEFAAKKGTDWKDLKTQAEFLDHELKTSPDEKRARDAMARATTAAEAAEAMMHYERPMNYTAANPRGGHGWANTNKHAASYAGQLGDFTADAVAANPNSLGAKKNSASYALGAALGGLFNDSKGTLSGGGDASAEIASNTGYRDPMVSTPAGRTARGEKDKAPKEVKDPRRGGFGALEEGLKKDDPLSVGKNLLGAVMNPVGYMLDSIQDGIRNSPEWNSEGPEGQPVNSFGERVANFFNSSTVDQSYRKGDDKLYGIGSGNSGSNERDRESTKESQPTPMPTPATVAPVSSVDLYAQLLNQLNSFTLDTTSSGKRKPYEWSTL